MSKLPARPLPHDFPPNLYESSRLQVAGVCLGSVWVQVGMLYGVPGGSKHEQPLYQSECLLEALVDRVACQIVGPRILCGDFNFEPHEMEQCQRLLSLGFREIQDVAACKLGHLPVPTGKGDRRIDHIWLSPELQEALVSLTVDDAVWSDHASILGEFALGGPSYTYDHWNMPKSFPWPETPFPCTVGFDSHLDPSVAYASMWYQLETDASRHLSLAGVSLAQNQLGRGQTLTTQTRPYCLSPCKLGREGDDHPNFTGLSLQHCRWFRQLRRLQALARSLAKNGSAHSQFEQRCNLWCAIKNAKGFGGGFAFWWTRSNLTPVFPGVFPYLIPSAHLVHEMYQSFPQHLRDFEANLMKHRVHNARKRRSANLQHVFHDCQKDRPSLVDALITSRQAVIAEVRSQDFSIVFEDPIDFRPALPLVCEGLALEVIHAETDQIWVEDVTNLSAGAVVRQDHAIVTDRAILHEFETVWKTRWQKFEHLSPSQWNQIVGFLQRVIWFL